MVALMIPEYSLGSTLTMMPITHRRKIIGKRSRSMMTATVASSCNSSLSSSSVAMMLTAVLSIMGGVNGNVNNGIIMANTAPLFLSVASTAFSFAPAGSRNVRQSLLHLPRPAAIQFSAKKRDESSEISNSINHNKKKIMDKSTLEKNVATLCTTLGFSALFLTNPLIPHLPYSSFLSSAHAEDELFAKYGSKGLDTSLVDKNCLLSHCSLSAKACLQDDPACRKGLTCTAKCLGDNSCITGCFAKYGNPNLDNLLKCTIEDHECIKVAILEGGADKYGEEPKSPAPTVQHFDLRSMEGTWYKVAGYNPNYDCYACQRNTFSSSSSLTRSNSERGLLLNDGAIGGLLGAIFSGGSNSDRLQVDVEFSMPRLLDDGSPPPPSGVRETYYSNNLSNNVNVASSGSGLQSVGYNQYSTHETMVFDSVDNGGNVIENFMKLGKVGEEKLYSRTAHSEGEMFGLKFWENWYIIGQNDPYQDEFKFIYYNGKTRQNTYDGAFVYSRTRNLSPSSMEKVYQIAKEAGMNPDQFCKIQNNCFENEEGREGSPYVEREGLGSPSNPFRGILASTRVSEILGVESVAAESNIPQTIADDYLRQQQPLSQASSMSNRPWWKEVGDYLEDPRRHFRLMDSLRTDMDWPEYIKQMN